MSKYRGRIEVYVDIDANSAEKAAVKLQAKVEEVEQSMGFVFDEKNIKLVRVVATASVHESSKAPNWSA